MRHTKGASGCATGMMQMCSGSTSVTSYMVPDQFAGPPFFSRTWIRYIMNGNRVLSSTEVSHPTAVEPPGKGQR